MRASGIFLALPLSTGCIAGEEGAPPSPAEVGAGFALLAELGCASCHASPQVPARPAARLDGVGGRLTPGAIAQALERPRRMPDCVAGREAAGALVHFLVAQGGPSGEEALALDAGQLERGRQLYHGVGCVACHAPFEQAGTLARPLWEFQDAFEPVSASAVSAGERRDPLALDGLRERTTLAALAAYLADPLAVHPAGRMPALLLDGGEARDLAAYLLYEDALDEGVALASGPGLVLEYFESEHAFDGETADFDALVPVRTEVAASFFEGIARREEDFGFRFRGVLAIPGTGRYTFTTTSDDASMLYLDGVLVVDNRGQHGMDEQRGEVQLAAGQHAFELTYFEHWGGNGLEVRWSGPGFGKRELAFDALGHYQVRLPARPATFQVDPALAGRGRELFGELRCGACHELAGAAPAKAAKPLAELDPRRGCLAGRPGRGIPRFALEPGERASLAAAIRARTPSERSAGERLEAELARLGCGACHERGALAGPLDERRSYFQVERGLDLGDEGRLPPSLERAGAKLRPEALRAVLFEGERVRPYMKTRMPLFGEENVAGLVELLATTDAPLRDESAPEFSLEAVQAGKELVGTKGLGCIQCHEFAGHPSLGIPAVDLARVKERVYPGWFRELLADPIALRMNTRMPAFWVDGKSPVKTLYDGDPARQIDAIWTYLSLGSSMPLPHGLVPLETEYEVEVLDEPVCVGVFMAGVSPRTIAVGLPERVHYAFDVQNSRLALAWRGRFFNARGTWHARAGQLERPAGEDVLEFPQGPAVAILARPDEPWPTENELEACGRSYPALLDPNREPSPADRRPSFLYDLGDLHVSETPEAVLGPGGGSLLRKVAISRKFPFGQRDEPLPVGVFLRAGTGRSIERIPGEAAWTVEADRRIQIRAPESAFVVTGRDGQAELRVPIVFREDTFLGDTGDGWGQREIHVGDLEVEYSW